MKVRFEAATTQMIQAHTESFSVRLSAVTTALTTSPRRGEELPYIGYIGMWAPKGMVRFSAALHVINVVSILADFGHFGHK